MSEQLSDQASYMLLVPHNINKMIGLYDIDDRVGDRLAKGGAVGPLAKVNLGGGQALVFGIGSHAHVNTRAQVMLQQWAKVYIELRGPVIFTGISARQALELALPDHIRDEVRERSR